MVIRATKINPAMLRWARERTGYSADEVARRQRVSPGLMMDWESGKRFPTWRQLERLAYQHYHRSPTLFFMETPPDEKYIDQEFDRLPSALLTSLHPDTLHAVREARLRQGDLAILLPPSSKNEGPTVGDLSSEAERWSEPDPLVYALHRNLRSSLARVQRETGNANEPPEVPINPKPRGPVDLDGFGFTASHSEPIVPFRRSDTFEYCRNLLEGTGVWVFLRPFKQKGVNGFCLTHDRFPVIYLNSSQDRDERILTMFNQWAHIAFDFNHIELSEHPGYDGELTGVERNIEIACRWFASIQSGSVPQLGDGSPLNSAGVAGVRSFSHLSFSSLHWQTNETIRDEMKSGTRSAIPKNPSRGGYYAIQKLCLGVKYIRTAFEAFEAERIDEHQLSSTLGVKGRYLQRLEIDALR